MDTKAAVAFKAGEPLSIETVQLVGPKAGECLVEIKATGVCHTDEFTRSGDDPEGLFHRNNIIPVTDNNPFIVQPVPHK